jgi:hypothetical protein
VGFLLLSGCLEFGLDPVDQEAPPPWALVTEHFVQAPLPSVDVLFVVDDTASMEREQATLAARLPALTDLLLEAGVQWQIGVVSTDMTRQDAGWLRGTPWVLTPGTEGLEAAIGELLQVGTAGSPPEAGLAAAERALELSRPGGPNAGFRRPGAALHVIFVSDADDRSDGWLGPDPADAFMDVLDVEGASGVQATASAVVGDEPFGCSSQLGTAVAAPRYREVATWSGGALVSICDLEVAPLVDALSEATIAWPTTFGLQETPVDGTMRVTVDGVRMRGGWTVAHTPPRLVFEAPPAPQARIDASYVVEVGL